VHNQPISTTRTAVVASSVMTGIMIAPLGPRLLAYRLLPPSMHLRHGIMTHASAGELLLDFKYFVRRRTHMVSR
jgi:hypothetical protein